MSCHSGVPFTPAGAGSGKNLAAEAQAWHYSPRDWMLPVAYRHSFPRGIPGKLEVQQLGCAHSCVHTAGLGLGQQTMI